MDPGGSPSEQGGGLHGVKPLDVAEGMAQRHPATVRSLRNAVA
ncbi:hypothetical protein [Streptomyces sp. CA-256286]|nr:hypothetical protein [Streptomyces sp. CA-256286]QTA37049.1 hypothetical protein JHY03_72650 [Streptomyces sp. CA-256286]QTA37071.1 hypothetical protein JHY03_72870 [Streptomyces sp. CA-256286]